MAVLNELTMYETRQNGHEQKNYRFQKGQDGHSKTIFAAGSCYD